MLRKCLSKSSMFTLISLSLLSTSPLLAAPVPSADAAVSVERKANQKGKDVLEGKVLSKSKKAKVLALRVDGKIEIVAFDDNTSGIEHAEQNENVVIQCSVNKQNTLATMITPGLVSLPAGVSEIDVDDLVELIDSPSPDSYLLIDARGGKRYDEGHIPSAISLPLPSLQENVGLLSTMVANKAKELIFYSDGTTCGLCTGAAKIAKEQGFSNVKVLLVGVQSWEEAGEVLAVGDELLKDGLSIVIDLRDLGQVASGHIPGALSIQLAELSADEMELDFPTDRSAPIVFYGSDIQIAKAMGIVRGWGYWQLRQVDGGIEGWRQRGQQLDSGSAPGVVGISWQPRIDENQISRQDFNQILAETPEDTLILDVRTAEEAKKGHIKSSLNVALEDLASKLSEIPIGKKIITHCATGSRAEVAALFLSQYRDDVRFLSAKVRCKGETCKVR